ncbi:MAG: hypothetical protein GF401_12390 [Chitinivibrionales bacterium]|nr:hypothetical protein [Chitinivibrionales bacterium]
MERDSATLEVVSSTATSVTVRLTLPPEMAGKETYGFKWFDVPLTLIIDEGGEELLYDLVPGPDPVTIEYSRCYTKGADPTSNEISGKTVPGQEHRKLRAVRSNDGTALHLTMPSVHHEALAVSLYSLSGRKISSTARRGDSPSSITLPLPSSSAVYICRIESSQGEFHSFMVAKQ